MAALIVRLRYDGTDLHGVPPAAGHRTVVGEIMTALARVGASATVDAPARTDAGVHAEDAAVVLADLTRLSPERAVGVLVRHLPGDLAVRAWAVVDAVPAVVDKTYRYTLDLSRGGLPLRRRDTWRPPRGFDEAALEAALSTLVGERDFAAWSRRGEQRAHAVRRIDEATWRRVGDCGELRLRGPAFTYRLVRSLVGALVALASGGLSQAAWRAGLAGERGDASVHQAPARGLCLEATRWEPEPPWRAP